MGRKFASIIADTAFFFDHRAVMFGGQHALLGGAGAFGVLTAEFFAVVPRGLGGLAFALLERGEEPFPGKLAVHALGTRILHGDGNTGGQMAQGDPRGDLVDVLSARTAGAAEGFLQFSFVQGGDGFHVWNGTVREYY
jgi:hypothetical protein